MFTEKELSYLIKIMGMLSSDFEGERANAASKATEILKNKGLTWEEFIRHSTTTTNSESGQNDTYTHSYTRQAGKRHALLAKILLENYGTYLNPNSRNFLEDLSGKLRFATLSDKQIKWLYNLCMRFDPSLVRNFE